MDTKQAYEKKLQAQLDEWNAEIEKLKARATKSEANAQLENDKQFSELRAKQEMAKEKLAELKQSGSEAWEDLKPGLQSAWNSLSDALKSAKSRF